MSRLRKLTLSYINMKADFILSLKLWLTSYESPLGWKPNWRITSTRKSRYNEFH